MKKQEYTLKDFKAARKVATFFTLYFWMAYSIARIGERFKVPEALVFPLGLSCYFMPVLLLLSWYMCYERYVCLELQTVEECERRNARHQIFLNMLVLGFEAITTYALLFGVTSFALQYWEYLEKLYGCLVLVVMCFFVWLLWLRTTVRMGKDGNFKYKVYTKKCFIGVTILIIAGTLMCVGYAYNRGEDEWFREVSEEINKEFSME